MSQENDHKNKSGGRTTKVKGVSLEPEILHSMLVDTGKVAGGNFSKFVVYLYNQWKKGNPINEPDEEIKKAVELYQKITNNEEIMQAVEKHGYGDIFTFIAMGMSALKKS